MMLLSSSSLASELAQPVGRDLDHLAGVADDRGQVRRRAGQQVDLAEEAVRGRGPRSPGSRGRSPGRSRPRPTRPRRSRSRRRPRGTGPRRTRPAAPRRPRAAAPAARRRGAGTRRCGRAAPRSPAPSGSVISASGSTDHEHHVVHVAVGPVLAGLDRGDDRMAALVGVMGGVAVRRGVAAPDLAADAAHPQVHPPGRRSSGTPRSRRPGRAGSTRSGRDARRWPRSSPGRLRARVDQRRERVLELVSQVLVLGRQAQRLAEVVGVLVDREARGSGWRARTAPRSARGSRC